MASNSETGKSDLATVPLDWDLSKQSTSNQPESGDSVIELTEGARAEVRRLMAEQNQAGLRLGIKGGGCSGLSYLLEFTEERDGDTVVAFDDIRVFLDRKSTIYLAGRDSRPSGWSGRPWFCPFTIPKQAIPVAVGRVSRFRAMSLAMMDSQLIRVAREQGFVARLGLGGLGLADPGWIVVSGRDAPGFVHSQVTNEVEGLEPGQGNSSARVNRQGQLLELFHVYRLPDRNDEAALGIMLPRARVPGLLSLFEEAIFADDVSVEDQSESWQWWTLQGLEAGVVLDGVFSRPGSSWSDQAEHSLTPLLQGASEGGDAFVIRRALAGDGGFFDRSSSRGK